MVPPRYSTRSTLSASAGTSLPLWPAALPSGAGHRDRNSCGIIEMRWSRISPNLAGDQLSKPVCVHVNSQERSLTEARGPSGPSRPEIARPAVSRHVVGLELTRHDDRESAACELVDQAATAVQN